jgi:hypothetical protein
MVAQLYPKWKRRIVTLKNRLKKSLQQCKP